MVTFIPRVSQFGAYLYVLIIKSKLLSVMVLIDSSAVALLIVLCLAVHLGLLVSSLYILRSLALWGWLSWVFLLGKSSLVRLKLPASASYPLPACIYSSMGLTHM